MTEQDKIGLKRVAGMSAGLSAGLGFIAAIEPHAILALLSDAANNEVAQAGFFFTLAAWIHSGRVKKEIAKHFNSLTEAINNVAVTLRQDLDKHADVLNNHKKILEQHTDEIKNLKTKHKHKPEGETNA